MSHDQGPYVTRAMAPYDLLAAVSTNVTRLGWRLTRTSQWQVTVMTKWLERLDMTIQRRLKNIILFIPMTGTDQWSAHTGHQVDWTAALSNSLTDSHTDRSANGFYLTKMTTNCCHCLVLVEAR